MVPVSAATTLVIPVAGATPGANNTFFRSDVNLINLRNAEQRVRIRWIPQGRTGEGIPSREMILPAQSGFFSEDFVTNVLQQTGIGSIEIQGVDAEGVFDPQGRLYATSRIWTPQPGTTGTVSQSLPVLTGTIAVGQRTKWIFGVRRDERYRLNVGILNRNPVAVRFRVQTIGSNPQGVGEVLEVDLPPVSMLQFNMPGASAGSFQVIVENLTENGGAWETWASSVDNVTGDAWSMIGFYPPQ